LIKRPKARTPLATYILLVADGFEGLRKSACRMHMFKGYVMRVTDLELLTSQGAKFI